MDGGTRWVGVPVSELEKKRKHYRISESEHEMIRKLLGRDLKPIEWALFSALWSEHCSYKSSKIHLKKFAQTMNSSVLNAAGENAGVVDLGQGERIVFKMESHNHPSFIEPYQGAATGVGGILRDIFTMGARPIALADYLCFGDEVAERMPALVDGVVRGISGYGNSVGVPTITGQTNFDSSYNKNILVNAMAVGLLQKGEDVALSAAQGVGNYVVYVGAKTGKDGVHGAAMASESFDADSEAKKPNVQIGDPYFEKLLIESCLEVLQKNCVVAIQDMGAAGLTSSSFEMSSKGQVGMRLRLDEVPIRDSSLQPEEILLSESQERMLLICTPEKYSEVQKIFSKWGLDALRIGEIIPERKVELYWHNEILTSIDPDLLVENAPVYQRKYEPWRPHSEVENPDHLLTRKINLNDYLQEKMKSVQYCSRKEIYRQYDQRVGLMTVRGADHDVAIQRLPDSKRGLAVVVGCRPHVMRLDAKIGGLDSVLYPALQMSLKGAKAIAVTDCLNFGNPEKEEIMSEFVAAVEGICETSLELKAPVISGNVSFYNETLGENIISTPATGLVGLRENIEKIPQDHFQRIGSSIYRISCSQVFSKGDIAIQTNERNEFFGSMDLKRLHQFRDSLAKLSFETGVLSNQMIGRGGMVMSLARMCQNNIGFKAHKIFSYPDLTQEVFYQTLWEIDLSESKSFEQKVIALGFKPELLGETAQGFFEIEGHVALNVQDLVAAYHQGLGGRIETMA